MPALQTTAFPPALHRFAQNPSAIAAIASFGAHALLFALLPFLPSASLSTQEPEIKRSVGVVELTPTEQDRLPEISNSLIELPSIARQPLPSLPYSLNPLPDPPAPSELPPYSGYSSSTSDPILDILRQYSDASKPVLVAPPALPAPPQPATPSPKPSGSPAPRPNSETQAPRTPSATQTTPSATPTPSSPTPSSSPSDTSQTADTSLPLPRSLDEIRQAQAERIRQRREQLSQLSADDTGIGNGAVAANMGTWSQAAGAWLGGDEQKFNQINFKEPTQIAAVYPETACPLRETRAVWVGVLVGVDGKVVNEPGNRPQILQGSSFRIFNQKAIEDAIAHAFEATGEKKAAILQVNYEYTPETCSDKASPQPNQ